VINLKRVGSPVISPNGRQVAYTIRETNWDENAYETEVWIADSATGRTRQVTNARKSSSQPAFSPDGAWLGSFPIATASARSTASRSAAAKPKS
jgi:Tol biopolymer transport system component